jgi:two-component system KDP operon response regulator KdpE
VHLTPIEYGLLAVLAQHAGRVITHAQILDAALDIGYEDATASLRVHVTRLRQMLEDNPAHPRPISNEPGGDYRLRAD